MLLRLEDFRYLINGFIDYYESDGFELPNPSTVRYIVSFFPDDFHQYWADLAEKHQQAGKTWQQAEWESLRYFVRDTAIFEARNPERVAKRIEEGRWWRYPKATPDVDPDDLIRLIPDDYFLEGIRLGASHNASLGPNANQILDGLEHKLRETERALKEKLTLEQQTTVKKRSTVKKELKADKEKRPSKKRSKFDQGMGFLLKD